MDQDPEVVDLEEVDPEDQVQKADHARDLVLSLEAEVTLIREGPTAQKINLLYLGINKNDK